MKIIKAGYESECIGYYGPSPGDLDFKPAEKPKKADRKQWMIYIVVCAVLNYTI